MWKGIFFLSLLNRLYGKVNWCILCLSHPEIHSYSLPQCGSMRLLASVFVFFCACACGWIPVCFCVYVRVSDRNVFICVFLKRERERPA